MDRSRAIRIGILVVLAIAVVWMFTSRAGGPVVEAGSTLVVDVEGDYVEAPEPPIAARLLGDANRPFAGLLSTLALARRDDRIDTVVLRLRGAGLGWGKAQELRDSVGRLREAGKKTIAYLEMATFSGSREYYIASAADEVVMPPGAMVPVLGLAAEYLFLGGVWEKLGVEIETERIGRYKTAIDSYTGKGMSESHAEMANSLLDSLNRQFVGGIAEGRGMTVEQVRAVIDSGPVVPGELRTSGLVDQVSHLGDLPAMEGPVVEAGDYVGIDPASVGFSPVANFALIYGSGTVVSGEGRRTPGGGPQFASSVVARSLAEAAEDTTVDAIILRIDSPGGSSLASEVIWKAIKEAKKTSGKPIIASLSDVAASGGYYAAVAADTIVADPGVLTGSIGVFVLRPVLGGLLEKVGVSVESLTRGEHADFLLSSTPLSDSARARLRTLVVDTYDLFVQRVAEGRDLPPQRVDELGQGRVWTGEQAVERGLVDELGGLHAAVAVGRRALGLEEDADVSLVPFPAPRSLGQQLAELIQGRVALLGATRLPLPEALRTMETWLLGLPARTPLLIPPMVVDIR